MILLYFLFYLQKYLFYTDDIDDKILIITGTTKSGLLSFDVMIKYYFKVFNIK